MLRIVEIAVVLAVCTAQTANATDTSVRYTGVNIAGGDFAANKLPGKYGRDYIYPDPETIAYFKRSLALKHKSHCRSPPNSRRQATDLMRDRHRLVRCCVLASCEMPDWFRYGRLCLINTASFWGPL